MSLLESAAWSDSLFTGDWTAAAGRRRRPSSSRPPATSSAGSARRGRPTSPSAAVRRRGRAADLGGGRRTRSAPRCCAGPGPVRASTPPRSTDWLVREAGSVPPKAAARDPHRGAGVLRGRRARLAPARRDPADHQAAADAGPPRPGRRRRRHLAVQLPADPLHPLGRPGAGARQRGDPQARPAHRGLRRRRRSPGSSRRPGCPPGCCTCCPAAPTPAQALVERPARPGHLLHRLDRGRAARSASCAGATSSASTWSSAATRR